MITYERDYRVDSDFGDLLAEPLIAVHVLGGAYRHGEIVLMTSPPGNPFEDFGDGSLRGIIHDAAAKKIPFPVNDIYLITGAMTENPYAVGGLFFGKSAERPAPFRHSADIAAVENLHRLSPDNFDFTLHTDFQDLGRKAG